MSIPSQSSFPNYSSELYYQSQPTFPNNPYFSSFPQPAPPSEPYIHPPGVDPYANLSSYPLTSVGFHGQSSYYEDPNAASQNWVVNQDVMNGGNKSSNPIWNGIWTHQPLANDGTIGVSMQNQVITQSFHCDACNVDCNSKDHLEKHILGKKHNKNLQMKSNPTSVADTVLTSSNTINNVSLPYQTGSIGDQMMCGISAVPSSEELETKRRKLLSSGTAVDSVRVCTICNVACNSQEVFNKHLAGRKHASMATLATQGEAGLYIAAVRSQYDSMSRAPKKTKVVQSARCEICKINCTSTDAYVSHLSGKKHQKNLEQLNKPNNDSDATSSSNSPAVPMIGPPENPGANKGKNVDTPTPSKKVVEVDLETKKRKVLEAGGTARAIRTCTICNVVCNSDTVLSYHLQGQKHKDMVKKLAHPIAT
ncbi:hypothetical protein UlMin_008360 [Ulmus minor]